MRRGRKGFLWLFEEEEGGEVFCSEFETLGFLPLNDLESADFLSLELILRWRRGVEDRIKERIEREKLYSRDEQTCTDE